MARHKSAEKRARQDAKRRDRNRAVRARTRSVVKDVRTDIAGSASGIEDKLKQAESALRRAASKGVIPKGRASRLVSRLHKAAARAKKS